MAAVGEVEAQLAGLRLHILHEARLTAAETVVDEVRHSVRTTSAQATASVKLALDLGERFQLIAVALSQGEISLPQAEAIVGGLKKLPRRLTRTDMERCQRYILGHTDTLGPSELRTLAARLAELTDPEAAEAEEAERLTAEERAARRDRFLRLTPDFHGSIRITGKLPITDAALLYAQLDALMPPASSYTDTDETATPATRRADALVLLAQAAAAAAQLPAHGGDRPHVLLTLSYDTLISGLGHIELLGTNGIDGISPSEARRLACDAGIIPMVLGTASQPLDVGRQQRFFTQAQRAALAQRDQGCAFPSCTATPVQCDAHHIVPWWAWGPTSVDNGVLLCPHHHRLVEPDPRLSAEAQWQIHLDPTTNRPVFTPPTHIDPLRRPRQHTRYALQQLPPPDKAPPCPRDKSAALEELLSHTSPAWAT